MCWTACVLVLWGAKGASALVPSPCCAFPLSICLVRGGVYQDGGGVTICSQGWETDFRSALGMSYVHLVWVPDTGRAIPEDALHQESKVNCVRKPEAFQERLGWCFFLVGDERYLTKKWSPTALRFVMHSETVGCATSNSQA